MSDAKRCLVVVCHNGPVVFVETVQSLVELGWGDRVGRAKAAHGFSEISFYWARNFPRVDAMRDSALELAKREGFSHVLFLDADMIWPTDVLERMLRHAALEHTIVSGLYCLRTPPYAPVAMGDRFRQDGSEVDQFHFVAELGEDLIDVDVVGMGCCLVPLSVLPAIGERPWFEYRNDDNGWPRVTEDVPFCLKAQAAGYRIVLDPTVKCGHVHPQVIDVRWHQRYIESVAASTGRMPFTLEQVAAPAAKRRPLDADEFELDPMTLTNSAIQSGVAAALAGKVNVDG